MFGYARQVTEPRAPPSRRNPRVGAALEAVVLTALAKARRPLPPWPRARNASPTATPPPAHRCLLILPGRRRLPSVVTAGSPTLLLTAPATARRRVRARWALVVGLGVVALLAVALWPRGGEAPAVRQPTGPASTAPATTSQHPMHPQAGLELALANLTEVLTAGQQQGMVDQSAQALLRQAQEVLRAAQQGKAEDAQKKLQDLQRKAEELIEKSKIRGAAAGRVRQAVAQFSQAVERW